MNNQTDGPDQDAGTSDDPTNPPELRRLRIWPALMLAALMPVARFAPALIEGGMSRYWFVSVFGPLLCCLLMLIWWLAASRATWKERVFGLIGLIASLVVTVSFVDPTMRGPGTAYLTLPMGMMALALGAALFAKVTPLIRTSAMLAFAFLGFGFSLLLRGEGMTGGYMLEMRWRGAPTTEALTLARRSRESATPAARTAADLATAALANPDWPGFRGPDRTGRFVGPRISTNWIAQPPRLIWKIAIGPAWSSFAVAGNLLFTQEQRGPAETVLCLDASSGREIWNRQVEARLDDPLGGPGPRATPTLADGALYVTGATGHFMRLNPLTGEIVWQQDLKKIAGRETPNWGFSASPLVVRSNVIVHAGGPGDKGLLGFDIVTGSLRWSVADGNDSYSSPQRNVITGEELVLMLTNEGLLLVDPDTGKVRLNYEWKFGNYRALQPTVVRDNIILLPTGMSTGTRALQITRSGGQLAAKEVWTSRNLKPDFTDLAADQNCVYGIDGGIFTSVDLKTGDRRWKDGRYGKGQTLFLEKSGLLLIAAEDGRVVLLQANPDEHVEIASFKAIEGKTWNHPVVVGDRLYLRNSQEAACYQLPLAGDKVTAALP